MEVKRRKNTKKRMRTRVENLCSKFTSYLNKFDRAYKDGKFTGPSRYFHAKVLERINQVDYPLQDTRFLEYLYATLTSWGMHRMGPKGPKLVEFDKFQENLESLQGKINKLQKYRITNISDENLEFTIDTLGKIVSALKVSASETQLITGLKTLHHLTPALVPPIDRQHTLRFFYNLKNPSGTDKQIIREMFPHFQKIAMKNSEIIIEKVQQHKDVRNDFHTSQSKVIDNAIIGFVLEELN